MSDALILIIGIVVFVLMLVGLGLTIHEFHAHVLPPKHRSSNRGRGKGGAE